VDLLTDDPSPFSPYNAAEDPEKVLDQTMAYTGNETRDGGQTPGPFEEMRRRMAGLQASSPISPTGVGSGGIRKKNNRKWKEKKRQWVWTIGTDPDDEESGEPLIPPTARPVTAVPKLSVPVKAIGTAAPSVPIIAVPAPRTRSRAASLAAGKAVSMMVPAAPSAQVATEMPALINDAASFHADSSVEPPTPSVETAFEGTIDVEMSDTQSFVLGMDHHALAMEMDLDMDTPVAVKSMSSMGRYGSRLSSVDSLGPNESGGQRRDTPVPS
jgi:hypothetical protein